MFPFVTLRASRDVGWDTLNCGLENIDKVENLSAGDTVVVNGTLGRPDERYSFNLYPCSIVD